MADALDSGSSARKGVGVRVPFSVRNLNCFSNSYIGYPIRSLALLIGCLFYLQYKTERFKVILSHFQYIIDLIYFAVIDLFIYDL